MSSTEKNKSHEWLVVSLSTLGLLAIAFASDPFSSETKRQAGSERGWTCERCGRRFSDGYCLECHHVIPTHDGGSDDIENLEILCLEDHADAHEDLGDDDVARAIRGRHDNRSGGRTRDWLERNT